jgi:hypothetical protein
MFTQAITFLLKINHLKIKTKTVMAKTKTENSNIVNELLAERNRLRPVLRDIEGLLNRYGYEEPKPEPQTPPATNGAGPKGPRLQTVLVKTCKAAGKPLTPEEAHAEAVKTNSKWTLQDVKDRLKTHSTGSNGKTQLFRETRDGRYESA